MARRRFAKLKALMFERDVTQEDLTDVVGRGRSYVSKRLNGREPWTLDDVQAVGAFLEIPREQWLDYFIDAA